MIDTPTIKESEAQTTAVIHMTIPAADCPKEYGPAIAELLAVLGEQGLAPAGPMFSHHLRRPTETFDFEVGFPVTAPVAPKGRVKPGQLPKAKVAHTIYHGPYEGLPQAWGKFCQWIDANNHKPAANLWECYSVGPHQSEDSAVWQTELICPLTV